MDNERTIYRAHRWLIGGLAPLLLATTLLVAVWIRFGGHPESATQTAGICQELLSGTTQGRQALLGSCWHAPLPILYYLVFAWLLPASLAGGAAFWFAWFFVFWSIREACKGSTRPFINVLSAQGAVALMAGLAFDHQALLMESALTIAFTLIGCSSMAEWACRRRTRHVIYTALASAALLCCGLPFWGLACAIVAFLPLATLGDHKSRTRLQAWLLLGIMPPLYFFAVWLLMNRLILGDTLFFLRSLPPLTTTPRLFTLLLISPALLAFPSLVLTWWRDQRARSVTNISAPIYTSFLVTFALMVIATSRILVAYDIEWTRSPLSACALATLILAIAHLKQRAYRTVLALMLCVWLSRAWFPGPPADKHHPCRARESTLRDVENHVRQSTEYGRVFALGYAGLRLLEGNANPMFTANLDLHPDTLRNSYQGENIFVLIPRPTGIHRAESVFWKYPGIYNLGAERLLFDAAFGEWRLFQILSAPDGAQTHPELQNP